MGGPLEPIVREWIEKADADFRVATREQRIKEEPSFDAVCFHCQQCVEKYIKGLLVFHNVTFPKVHNLGYLLDLLLPQYPLMEGWRSSLNDLTIYGGEYRYPGESATEEQVKQAYKACRAFRDEARTLFGL